MADSDFHVMLILWINCNIAVRITKERFLSARLCIDFTSYSYSSAVTESSFVTDTFSEQSKWVDSDGDVERYRFFLSVLSVCISMMIKITHWLRILLTFFIAQTLFPGKCDSGKYVN